MFPDEDGSKTAARANFDDLFWALVTVFQVRGLNNTAISDEGIGVVKMGRGL